VVTRWSWLGDHLALDVANTVRRRGMHYRELLNTPADLTDWLTHQGTRVPAPSRLDAATLTAFTTLRDPVLRLLRAAAAGDPRPPPDVRTVNAAVLTDPPIRLLTDRPGRPATTHLSDPEPLTRLLATAAAATVELLTTDTRRDLTLCDAPGCGQLYLRARPNQQWCDPHCGVRARGQRLTERRRAAAT